MKFIFYSLFFLCTSSFALEKSHFDLHFRNISSREVPEMRKYELCFVEKGRKKSDTRTISIGTFSLQKIVVAKKLTLFELTPSDDPAALQFLGQRTNLRQFLLQNAIKKARELSQRGQSFTKLVTLLFIPDEVFSKPGQPHSKRFLAEWDNSIKFFTNCGFKRPEDKLDAFLEYDLTT